MKLVDITPAFFEIADTISLESLNEFFTSHPEIYSEYFPNHCPKTEERLQAAIERYPTHLKEMKSVATQLPNIIKDTMEAFSRYFGIELDLNFYIIVGGYGSNAFVERKIIGGIYFAVEKLSANSEHLKVIVAHEIGHVYHNALSNEESMDWPRVDWTHGLTTLYREGVATYLSKTIARGYQEDIYYAYDESGVEWLSYCEGNLGEIAKAFLQDSREWSFEKEREWFRLSGGRYFGYNRLGYYLGTKFVEDLVKEVGEREALTYWANNDLKSKVVMWLEERNNELAVR